MSAADPIMAQLQAEMESSSAALELVTATLCERDGLMNPALIPIFDRVSRRATRQIGDHNFNF